MNKKYLVALTVVALFATASVSANTAFKKITATERPDYKIVVNNDAVELQNNPITINGVTYLPLREVATILDQEVGFDKGVISLISPNEEGDKMNKILVLPRALIEALAVKYPKMVENNTLQLDNNGVLLIGDVNYQLELTPERLINISPLIEAGVISESDL